MATGLGTNNMTTTTTANFIPEIWSDEVIAAYKKNLVMANLVKKMNFKGKKGDAVNIPVPGRGSASIKAAADQVTLVTDTANTIQVLIDKHYEYSMLIEDIAEVQALASMRQFYTDDAGYALSKQIDTSLIGLGSGFNGGAGNATYDKAYIGGDGTTFYTSGSSNASALTDAAIRRTIQRLDDSDVPMDGRFFVIPPSGRNTIMGLARFTEQAFTGEAGRGNTIRNGNIGDVYGIPVFVSTNCATATGGARIALMGHKDSMVLVEQLGVRSQAQYKQEYLGTLYTADTLYGVKELRNDACFALAIPA